MTTTHEPGREPMRDPRTLTSSEGYALTDTKHAVRLSGDVLVTHTAVYKWSNLHECWMLDQGGLVVDQCKSQFGTFTWDATSQTFHWHAGVK